MEAEKIKQLREARNMTMTQLAADLGVTPSYINRLERGEIELTVSMLKKIAGVFGVPFIDLL